MGEIGDCGLKEVHSGGTHLTGMSTAEVEWFWSLKDALVERGHYEKRWCADSEMCYDGDVSFLRDSGYSPEEAAQEIADMEITT